MENKNTENKDRAAFACVDGENRYIQTGLTKREYFAGLAMQGLLLDYSSFKRPTVIPELAVAYTDKLLEELEK